MLNSNNLFKELGLPESPIVEKGDGYQYEEYEQDPQLPQYRKQILELTIQLTPDYSSTINIYQGDKPEKLAQDFGEKHHLPPEAIKVIAQHIHNHFPKEETPITSTRQGKENSQQEAIQNIIQGFNKIPYLIAFIKKQSKRSKDNKTEKWKWKRDRIHICPQKAHQSQVFQQILPISILKGSVTSSKKSTLLLMSTIRKANEEKRVFQQEEQMKEYTFKPEVSQKSLKIIQQKRSKTPQGKHEDQLLLQGLQQKERKRTASFLKNTTTEATFKPQVNQISAKIVQEKTKRSQTTILQDKCEQLYQMAKDIQIKKDGQQKKEDLSFRPKINRQKSDRQYIPFLERVDITLKLRYEKSQQDEQNQLVDQTNGQKLYKPKICRPPKIERNRGGMPVWDYLFHHQRKDDSEIHFANDQIDESQLNKSITERQSHKIQYYRSDILVNNMRRQRLEEFFLIMDSDRDGFISADACNLEELPVEALELLQPVLLQMEQLGVQMNTDIWIDKALSYSSNLSIADKNRLYAKKKTYKDETAEMFNPKINQKSQRIASQKRNYSGCEGLYGYYQQEVISKEIKRQQQIKNKIDKEKQECTFQPRINTSFK